MDGSDSFTVRPVSPTQHTMPFPSTVESPSTPALSESASTSSSDHEQPTEGAQHWQSSPMDSQPSSSGTKLPPLQKIGPNSHRPEVPVVVARNERPAPVRSVSSHAASRPSSMTSTSSASDGGSSQVKFPLSPSILSPSLATALGIGVEPRKGPGQMYASYANNSSSASLAAPAYSSSPSPNNGQSFVHAIRPPRRSTGGASATANSSAGSRPPRRPSLPNVPSMTHHRISTISVSSFESLPENDALPSFAGSPMLTSHSLSRQSSTRSRCSDQQPGSPGLVPTMMLPPASLPTHRNDETAVDTASEHSSSHSSPTTPSGGFANATIRAPSVVSTAKNAVNGNRPSRLIRAQTEPAGAPSLVPRREKMKKRGHIARELLTTERAYVECLQVIKECFYQPLLDRCGGAKGSPNPGAGAAIVTKKALNDIFSNFIDIFALNSELLVQLQEKLEPEGTHTAGPDDKSGGKDQQAGKSQAAFPTKGRQVDAESSKSTSAQQSWDPEQDTIGDVLVPIAPFLKMYSLYVKNFSAALNHIETERKENEAFARFLKDTEKSTWGRGKGFFGLGLQAHLLSIVQRIPRYKLLVGDLLKNTPSNHPDHSDLQRAFDMIEAVASSINENVRQHEMVMLMLAIQRSLLGVTTPLVVPGRSLIKRGTLMKACRKDIQARAFFLFTDCIVYAKPASGGGAVAIEAAWGTIARAGGIVPNGPLAKFNNPLPPGTKTQRSSADHGQAAQTSQPRLRASSGNLFSANAILDALQAPQAPQLQFRELIALQDCTVVGIEENTSSSVAAGAIEAGGTPFGFEIRTPNKSFAVYAETAEAREAWLDSIREARSQWQEGRRTLQAEEDSIVAKRDRRRSVAAAAAAAKARQSVYSLHSPTSSTFPDVAAQVNVTGPLDDGIATNAASRPMSLTSLPTTTSFAALLNSGNAATGLNGEPLRVLEDYNAPAWVPDSRADRCMCCSEGFGVFRRKHHCRLCGRVVCWSCSTQRFIIASYEETKEDAVARACDSCYESTFPPLSPGEACQEADESNNVASRRGSNASVRSTPGDERIVRVSGEESDQHRRKETRPHVVRFESRESSVGADDPATPLDGQDLEEGNRSGHSSRQKGDGADAANSAHFDALTAPLKVLALENGPMTAPGKLDEGASNQEWLVKSPPQGRAGSRLPNRLPSSIGGNPPAGPSGPARAARARLSMTDALGPHVHAATSGSGTFRLAPPRITTPEDEGGTCMKSWDKPGYRKGLMGVEGSYFAGAVIPEDGIAEHGSEGMLIEGQASTQQQLSSSASAASGLGEPFAPSRRGHAARHSIDLANPLHAGFNPRGVADSALARHRSRKKPMSAAARLSTYYGNSLAINHTNNNTTTANNGGSSSGVGEINATTPLSKH